MAVGRVLRFDSVKGYGFIEPEDGGEDLFLHVNDLLVEKSLIRAGTVVEFDAEVGDKGMKAARVHVPVRHLSTAVGGPPDFAPGTGSARPSGGASVTADSGVEDDELCVVLSREEFTREMTELLLKIEPALSGPQILAVRGCLASVAARYRWLEDVH